MSLGEGLDQGFMERTDVPGSCCTDAAVQEFCERLEALGRMAKEDPRVRDCVKTHVRYLEQLSELETEVLKVLDKRPTMQDEFSVFFTRCHEIILAVQGIRY